MEKEVLRQNQLIQSQVNQGNIQFTSTITYIQTTKKKVLTGYKIL